MVSPEEKLILVVDDEPRMVRFVRMNLELEGYQVSEAGSGMEALEKVRDEIPDLVLLDVMMPEMDGFETLERLREISRESGIYGDRVTLKPKGELAVEIDSYAARGLRKRWGDTPRRCLEDQLGRCVVTMEVIARIERERRLKCEEEERQAEKRRQEEAEKRRLAELQAARVRKLRELAADWRAAGDRAISGGSTKHAAAGATATRANAPPRVTATTASPLLMCCTPGPTSTTTPLNSEPGTNGGSSLSWYWPAI